MAGGGVNLLEALRFVVTDPQWLRAVIDDLRIELESQRARADRAERRLAYQHKFLRSAGQAQLIIGDER